MSKPFFDRLRDYYSNIGKVLRGEADAASIFPNATDIGMSRERVYAEILRLHLPPSCNVVFGGFLFDLNGNASGQIDILILNQSSLQFNFSSGDGSGKSFACIDGCVGIVSVKSRLDKGALEHALENIASIPDKQPLAKGRYHPGMSIPNYEDWPYKIIYASDGWVRPSTLVNNLNTFYADHPGIPFHKRPNLIHIAGKCMAYRASGGFEETRDGTKIEPNKFSGISVSPDVVALLMATIQIQYIATTSVHIQYDYTDLLNKMNF
jgi:hypothetical protein